MALSLLMQSIQEQSEINIVVMLRIEFLSAAFFNRNICEFREANVFLLFLLPAFVKCNIIKNFSDNKS